MKLSPSCLLPASSYCILKSPKNIFIIKDVEVKDVVSDSVNGMIWFKPTSDLMAYAVLKVSGLNFSRNSLKGLKGMLVVDSVTAEILDSTFHLNSNIFPLPQKIEDIITTNKLVPLNSKWPDELTLLSQVYGGAACLSILGGANVVVQNSKFIENESIFGGGIFASGNSDLRVSDTSFQNNKGYVAGGGIYHNLLSSVHVKRSYFLENVASFGGAVASVGSSYGEYADCEFTSNSADISGGGIFLNVIKSLRKVNRLLALKSRGNTAIGLGNFIHNIGDTVSFQGLDANPDFIANDIVGDFASCRKYVDTDRFINACNIPAKCEDIKSSNGVSIVGNTCVCAVNTPFYLKDPFSCSFAPGSKFDFNQVEASFVKDSVDSNLGIKIAIEFK
jgi:hypothetical protein